MKTNKIITIGLLSAGMLLTGCTDSFLEVKSYTQNPIEDYFTDSAHVHEALVAAYDPMHWPDWAMGQYNPQNVMSDIMADDIWPGGQSKTDNQYWHLMMNYEAKPNNCMTGLWTDEYSGVKRANDLMKYIQQAGPNIPADAAKMWTAEGRVLRAYYYNNLWKFWGNIPYYTVNLESPYTAPQLSADEVYGNVIADLESVIDENTLPMKWDSDNLGRMSGAMAKMLYAEMVMYQNDNSRYSKALTYMKDIIGSGQYDLNPDYAALWKQTGEWCIESIYEINYTDDKSFRGWGSGEALIAGGTVLPRLVSNPGGVADLGIDDGWGFCPVRTETYQRYADNDKRRDATCLDLRNYDYNARYQDTKFWLAKYTAYSENVARATGDKQLNYNNNLRIYRYSETLLNAAELILRTNGSDTEAKGYLTKVRQRAGLQTEKDATIDNIIEERHLEFVGEGKRYWDLVRTGKASTVLVPDEYGYRTNTWSENRKYQPIPNTEMAADPALKQNADY